MTAARKLRIAVLGNLDSIHVQRWLRAFAERGYDMHAVSFYPPQQAVPEGVTLHVLKGGASKSAPPRPPGEGGSAGSKASWGEGGPRRILRRIPPSLLRPIHGARYLKAGLKQTLEQIHADVIHAHYVVEYGFYAAQTGVKPLVVSAWGSDVYRDVRGPASNAIARFTLGQAALVTGSDAAMVEPLKKLGVAESKLRLVRIGALDEPFFAEWPVSVNAEPAGAPPTIVSTRALEPLYNVDSLLRAFARIRDSVPGVRLLVAHDGSQRTALDGLARQLDVGGSVAFLGRLSPLEVRDVLSGAHVYVSVPSSDSMAASTMEAMARGAFPVVSDLPSQDGFIEHGVTGLRVTPGDVDTLAMALRRALADGELRRSAALLNRKTVEAEGRLAAQVDRLEEAMLAL